MEIAVKSILSPLFKLRDDVGDLSELKNSLKEQGQLIPIIVRKDVIETSKGIWEDRYRLIDGHRRWTACLELGWEQIRADVIEGDDKKALLSAIIANLERRDLDPIEEAKAFNLYINEKGYGSAVELANAISRTESWMSQRLGLLDLPDDTLQEIKTGRLTPTHGIELARLDTEQAVELTNIAKEVDLDTNQLRKAVGFIKNANMNVPQAVHTVLHNPDIEVPKQTVKFDAIKMARQQIVLTLQKALKNIDFHLDGLEEGPERGIWIRDVRYKLHELINVAQKIQKEYSKG